MWPFTPAWKNKDWIKRKAAVAQLTELPLLATIAVDDAHEEVRAEALKKLPGGAVLAMIVLEKALLALPFTTLIGERIARFEEAARDAASENLKAQLQVKINANRDLKTFADTWNAGKAKLKRRLVSRGLLMKTASFDDFLRDVWPADLAPNADNKVMLAAAWLACAESRGEDALVGQIRQSGPRGVDGPGGKRLLSPLRPVFRAEARS